MREFLQFGHFLLQAGRHVVEGRRQRGQVVGPAYFHPLAQVAGGQPLGAAGGLPDRDDHPAGDQRGNGRQQEDQREPDHDDGPLDQREGLLLLGEREHVVQLVNGAHRRADDDPWNALAAMNGHQHGWLERLLVVPDPLVVGNEVDQLGRDAGLAIRALVPAAGVRVLPAIPIDHDRGTRRAAGVALPWQLGENALHQGVRLAGCW